MAVPAEKFAPDSTAENYLKCVIKTIAHCALPLVPGRAGAEGEIISGHYAAIRRAELVLSSSLHPGKQGDVLFIWIIFWHFVYTFAVDWFFSPY